MPKMLVVYFCCILSFAKTTNTSPLEDDLRALKAEMDNLKSKTDLLEHNYTMLQFQDEQLKMNQHQQSAQMQQNKLTLQQDLMFVQQQVNNLQNISNSSSHWLSFLQNETFHDKVKMLNKIAILENHTRDENLKAGRKVIELEHRINLENGTISAVQRYETALNTKFLSHVQDYYALKNTVQGIKQKVHSAIAFKATLHGKQPIHPDSIIKFDRVLINYGNSYSSGTGQFVCPKSGLYIFVVTLDDYKGKGLHFRVNGDTVQEYYGSSSVSTLLQLKISDHVWVSHQSPYFTVVYITIKPPTMTGSFLGYLIASI